MPPDDKKINMEVWVICKRFKFTKTFQGAPLGSTGIWTEKGGTDV